MSCLTLLTISTVKKLRGRFNAEPVDLKFSSDSDRFFLFKSRTAAFHTHRYVLCDDRIFLVSDEWWMNNERTVYTSPKGKTEDDEVHATGRPHYDLPHFTSAEPMTKQNSTSIFFSSHIVYREPLLRQWVCWMSVHCLLTLFRLGWPCWQRQP